MTQAFFLKAVVLPCILVLCTRAMIEGAACASESPQVDGRVSMLGSIINTPCAIATSDLEQTVDMKITTVGEIIDEGQGHAQPFSLTLVNCTQEDAASNSSRFSTTFDGPSEDGLFKVSGAYGVGLQIADANGNIASPGKALPEGTRIVSNQRLEYTMRLVRNHTGLKTGDYTATLRFKVDYF